MDRKKPSKKTGCEFCKITEIKEGIIYQNKDFYVKVGFAIIAPGHVMIIPKNHYACLAEAPLALIKKYDQLKKKLKKEIKKKFADPIIIEYGVWGQSIEHAHIHFIPKKNRNYKIRNIFKEIKLCNPGEKVNFRKIKNYQQLKFIYKKEGGYVMVESKEKIRVYSTKNLKSKRNSCLDYRVLFTNKGLTGVKNWRRMTKKEKQADQLKREKTKLILSFDDF